MIALHAAADVQQSTIMQALIDVSSGMWNMLLLSISIAPAHPVVACDKTAQAEHPIIRTQIMA